jgi:hypothetical protein
MKLYNLTLIAFCLITTSIHAQVSISVGTSSEVNMFTKRTTCFVIKDELISDYNDIIKQSVEQYWTITPYEFIGTADFHKMRTDKNYAFIVLNQVSFDKDKTNTRFDFMIATLGGNYKTINDMPTLCAIPLCYNGDDEENYVYKLPLVIKFIQNHIQVCKDNPELDDKSIVKYYTDKADNLTEKTLYLNKADLDSEIRSESSFSENYTGNFKITDIETIQSIIDNNNSDAAILHLIKPQPGNGLDRCFKLIIGVENAQLYYYDMHSVNKKKPALLLKSDIKNMQK